MSARQIFVTERSIGCAMFQHATGNVRAWLFAAWPVGMATFPF